MSEKQDPKDVEKKHEDETKAADELAAKELDQVVGGGVEPSPWYGQSAQPGQGLNIENRPNLNAKEWGASKPG
jgi:hypothetical protein